MKSAEEQRRLDAEATIRDLKLRVTRLEHRLNNLLEKLDSLAGIE